MLPWKCASRIENPSSLGTDFTARTWWGGALKQEPFCHHFCRANPAFLWLVLIAQRPNSSSLGVQHKPTHCTRYLQPWPLFLVAEGLHYHNEVSRNYYSPIRKQAKPSNLWYSHLAMLFGLVSFPGNPSASAVLNFNKCYSLLHWANVWNSPWVLLPHAPAIMNTKAYFSDLNLLKI